MKSKERNLQINMQSNYSEKANRILYIVIISVLCLTALIVGIVASVTRNRSAKETEIPNIVEETPTDVQPETTPDEPVYEPDNSNVVPTFIAPAKGIVSKNHSTDVTVFSQTMRDYRTHTGIDISTSVGTEVYAAADGTVSKIWTDEFMGKCISISHNGDAITVYKNLSEELADGIAEGVSVRAGQPIACVGETARIESADEPHLHFELLVKNVYVNPLDYISEDSKNVSLSIDEAYEG